MEKYQLRSLKKDKDIGLAILFYLVPGVVLMTLFQLLPIITAFEYSFFKVNLMNNTRKFLGLKNYATAFTDKVFLGSLWITVKYFLMRVPLQMVFGFLLSLLIAKSKWYTTFMRTIILVPVITSMVVATAILGLMFHPSNGLVNAILALVKIPSQGFLTDASQALWTIALITIWKNVGLTMLFFLAGLLSIPITLYEAAEIDGVNTFQKHWYVTIPMLRSTIAFIFLTTTIRSFQVFGPVLLTTNGGPAGATKVVVMSIYENAFTYNQIGYASALSIILATILIVISAIQKSVKKHG